MSSDSPFLALPAELRIQIYGSIFSVPSTIDAETGSNLINSNESERKEDNARQRREYSAGEVRVRISSTVTIHHTNHDGQPINQQNFTAIFSRAVRSTRKPRRSFIAKSSSVFASAHKRSWLELGQDHDHQRQQPLHDLSLFERMQNVHLDLDFGPQVNPIWDALPVIRALVLTLPSSSSRISTTAAMRFGVVTAITVSRLLNGPWSKFLQELDSIDLGCRPDVEVDEDAAKWVQFNMSRFEELRDVVRGTEVRFVRFEERLGPSDKGLKACCVM